MGSRFSRLDSPNAGTSMKMGTSFAHPLLAEKDDGKSNKPAHLHAVGETTQSLLISNGESGGAMDSTQSEDAKASPSPLFLEPELSSAGKQQLAEVNTVAVPSPGAPSTSENQATAADISIQENYVKFEPSSSGLHWGEAMDGLLHGHILAISPQLAPISERVEEDVSGKMTRSAFHAGPAISQVNTIPSMIPEQPTIPEITPASPSAHLPTSTDLSQVQAGVLAQDDFTTQSTAIPIPSLLASPEPEAASDYSGHPVDIPDTADADLSAASTNGDTSSVFDEDYHSDTSSYTASLLSDVKDFTYENGRRYHSYREGHYVLPNDDQEQDRQDLLHHVRNLVLNGALFRAPLSPNIQRVLDIGTGTGIWAIDFADSYPSAEVIGTDLSPIQPSWVPPNLRFTVDDAESPWLYSASRPFDFIHTRDLGGAIADWPRLLRQAYGHLRPGGWVELQEFEVTLKSDDDSLRLAPTLREFIGRLHEASEAFHRPMNIAEGHRQRLMEAGFEDVRDEVYKVPSSGWSRDPVQKQIGRYNLCSLLMAVESYSLALFTRVLGWSNNETQVFLAGVRKDLKNPDVHTYCNLHVVYGRKPWYDYGELTGG